LEDYVDSVRLPDLETIRRFSIAVRSEHAPAEDVLEALRSDLERIERAIGRRRAPASRASVPASRSRSSSSARKTRR
jgi:hypothetical protein